MIKQRWLLRSLMLVLVVGLLLGLAIPAFAYSSTSSTAVVAQYDNCDIWFDGANWNFTTGSPAVQTGYYNATYMQMGSGMRFENIQIPQGCTITNAYLQLQAYSATTYTGAVSSIISGQATSSSGAFNYTGQTGYNNYITRTKTIAQVSWPITQTWQPNDIIKSPDISSVVREVMAYDWNTGYSITIFWEDAGTTPVLGNCRQAYAYGQGGTPPTLIINYTYSNTSSTSQLYYYLNGTYYLYNGGAYSGSLYYYLNGTYYPYDNSTGTSGSAGTVDLSGVVSSIAQVQKQLTDMSTSVTAASASAKSTSDAIAGISTKLDGLTTSQATALKQTLGDVLASDSTIHSIAAQAKAATDQATAAGASIKTASDQIKAIQDQMKVLQDAQAKSNNTSLLQLMLFIVVVLAVGNLIVLYNLMKANKKAASKGPAAPSST